MSNTSIDSNTKMPTFRARHGGPDRFKPQEKAKDASGTLRRLLSLYQEFKGPLIISALLILIASLVSVVIPYFVGKTFDTFNVNTNFVEKDLLLTILSILFLLYGSNWLISTISSYLLLTTSQKLIHFFRRQFFDKIQRLPLLFYDTHSHGDLMSRITNDADNISSTITTATTNLLSSLLTVSVSLVIMFSLNFYLTITVLIAMPLVALLTKIIAGYSKKYFLAQQIALGNLNGVIEENIVGLKIVKAFGKQKSVLDTFINTNNDLYNNSLKAQMWAGYMMPLMNVINNLIFASVALVGGYLAVKQQVLVGTVISFMTYSKQFSHPLNNIAGMFNTIQQALAGAERIFEILDEVEETADNDKAITLKNPQGNIRFEHVSFAYQEDHPVLKDVSFEVKAGETIALVGETGSGKTTIVNLLNRFYDVNSGNIYLDDIDIRDIKRVALRGCFSVVLQETSLFSGTIMDNIRYARNNASNSQVKKAAKIAHADSFITRLPLGYNTLVSGASDTLSQGQKQLLAIARAVLCESPILILDEATSSVDTKTEKEIQKALLSLIKNHTSFLIAHRLSTIKDADRILVVKDGFIAENGNHQQLMEKRGYYYKMVNAQMGHYRNTKEKPG